MSSTDVLQPSPPEVSDATLAADVPDNLLNQLMDQHDAEQQLQNLQLQSGSGSQETGTEAAIPLRQGTGSPTSPISLTETMDDMDDTYAPTDDDDEEEDSTDSVEFIAETQVQEEEIQSTQLAPPQSSQMTESHQVSAAAPVRDSTEDSEEALRAIVDQQRRAIENAQRLMENAERALRERSARRARQEQGPEPRNVRPRASPEQGRQAPRHRQASIDPFVINVRGAHTPDPRREPAPRRLSAHPDPSEIPLPQNEQSLYDQWIATRMI